ncbi:MAG: hypothetical protein IJ735_08170, partial [Clostridia bacterium]|nr:hypothetical protein [Clostridia bacterium]
MKTAQKHFVKLASLADWERVRDVLSEEGYFLPDSLPRKRLPPYNVVFISEEKRYLSPVTVSAMGAAVAAGRRVIAAD